MNPPLIELRRPGSGAWQPLTTIINVTAATIHLTSLTINPPTIKKARVTVPGADGITILDTATTNGQPRFSERTITLDYTIPWNANTNSLLTQIMAITGTTWELRINDDPTHYYSGVLELTAWDTHNHRDTLTFTLTFTSPQPWRYNTTPTIITATATSSPGTTINLPINMMSVQPQILTTATVTIISGTTQWQIPASTQWQTIPQLWLNPTPGQTTTTHQIRAIGTTQIQIRYTNGTI
jgi:hypothetical protein